MSEQENTSTNMDLYNLRARLQKNRENLQNVNGKYLELTEKIDNLVTTFENTNTQISQLVDKITIIEKKLFEQSNSQLSYEDVSKRITEWSSAELQPILDELCSDIENATCEVKTLKMKQSTVRSSVDDDVVSVDVRTAKPVVKTLQLQKKTSRF